MNSEGMERVKGIEPSYSAWKAAALPLSYTRADTDMPSRAAIGNGVIELEHETSAIELQ
jgi:hypothetical protein